MAELVWKRMPEAMTMDVEAQKCHRQAKTSILPPLTSQCKCISTFSKCQ